jgi:hypothetical protein
MLGVKERDFRQLPEGLSLGALVPRDNSLTGPRDERLVATDVAKAGNASGRSTRRAG